MVELAEASNQQQPTTLIFDAALLSGQAEIPQVFLCPTDKPPLLQIHFHRRP
jgi:hypothetical protein